jgi:hypothetical protein
MKPTILENMKLRLSAAAATSAGTAVAGALLDMQGFERAVAFATIATANAGNYLKWQHGDASDGSDLADLEGTKVVAAANGDIVACEIENPQKRYLKPVLIRAGANTATGDLYVMQSGARVLPVSNNESSEIVSEVHVAPVAGTV